MTVEFITIGGREVKLAYEEVDFSKHPTICTLKLSENPGVKYLVFCDPIAKRIEVDRSAPDWYKEMAVLHETICALHEYESLIPKLKQTQHRCKMIEKFVTEAFPAYSKDYIEARKQMFELLIDGGLNNSLTLVPTYIWLREVSCT